MNHLVIYSKGPSNLLNTEYHYDHRNDVKGFPTVPYRSLSFSVEVLFFVNTTSETFVNQTVLYGPVENGISLGKVSVNFVTGGKP